LLTFTDYFIKKLTYIVLDDHQSTTHEAAWYIISVI